MPPIPLLTVLSNIPWGQVIDNAPKIAEGAGKLWNAVSRRGKSAQTTVSAPDATINAQPHDVRLSELEVQVGQLQEQMQASSELIQALANQNANLILGLEQSREKLQTALRSLGFLGVVLVGTVLYLLVRP